VPSTEGEKRTDEWIEKFEKRLDGTLKVDSKVVRGMKKKKDELKNT
jgi:hypothetical protein